MTGKTDELLAAMGIGATATPTGPFALAEPPWPKLDPAALYGPIGEAVRIIEPETEADPAAVLVSLLAGIGAMVGSGPNVNRGHTQHAARVFAMVVGDTAAGGKGTSLAAARLVLDRVAPDFMVTRTLAGFGSGEALVDAVADPDPDRDTDGNKGAPDKRVLMIEQEYSRVLKASSREGSTLSPTIRAAWDGGKMEARSRARTAVATGHHVCVIGHVVPDELRRHLTATDTAGGTANRFMFVCARRSKLLPHGGRDLATALTPSVDLLRRRVDATRKTGSMDFTPEGWDRYGELYRTIEMDAPGGLLGSVIARGSPHTLRVALLYALLDGATAIDVAHLDAAHALWRYCRDSAAYVFGDSTGDPIADKILAAVRANPDGLTLTQLDAHLGKHAPAHRRDAALAELTKRGKITTTSTQTGGRPTTTVRAT